MKLNAGNERVKRQYFLYLREAKRLADASIDQVAAALDRFETFTRHKDFAAFRIEQAVGFKANLARQQHPRTGTPLSKATVVHILADLKAFFVWLAGQPGYRSKLSYGDAEYFNPPNRDIALARADEEARGPTLEQVHYVLGRMPCASDVEKRDRAVIAFALLTGARDNAIASLRLRHLDLKAKVVVQDAKDVRTKASKRITTAFFPVGQEAEEIVLDYVRFLVGERQWGLDDPLFPATRVVRGPNAHFCAAGLDRRCWSNANPIRRIFREAFGAAGLPDFNPHSIRNTLARLGQSVCRTPEEFKCWSQNLGHDGVMTTFASYGRVPVHRQREVILGLDTRNEASEAEKKARVRELIRQLVLDT